ncbi:MAG: hypothetical protein JWR02_2754 [Mucilaginibacter sp.]|nr:hypothetical protein [Mucilaginibacter sp.]
MTFLFILILGSNILIRINIIWINYMVSNRFS